MNICVVGWYFYEELYKTLKDVNKAHEVFIVSHKDDIPKPILFDLQYVVKENVGLEFGAYDYFLKNCWDKKSDVLFMHDDIKILDPNVFDKIEEETMRFKIDQAYLFKNKAEEVNNGGKHGRSIFMSSKLLNFMLNYKFKTEESEDHLDIHHNKGVVLKGTGEYTGFWYDPCNLGHTTGKPPVGVRHYNEMIYTFHRTMGRIRDKRYGNEPMNVVNRLFYPEIDCARRGAFRVEKLKINKDA